MKTFLTIIFLLTLSLSSFAQQADNSGNAWECVGKTVKDDLALKKLKLDNPLIISKKDSCGHAINSKYLDLCFYNEHKLFVGPKDSIFKLKTGTDLKLKCIDILIFETEGAVGGSN